VLTSLRYTRFNMWISLLSFVLMPSAFLFASRWGATAVAACWIALSPITVLPLVVRLLRAVQVGYSDYAGVLAPALVGSAAMVAAVLALRTWLMIHDIRPVVQLSLEVAIGGATYAGFLLVFCRDRLSRYFQFLVALRRGSPGIADQELVN